MQEKAFIRKGKVLSARFRGHYGQMEVIKRRTDAFEHLKKYEMLLQQLISPKKKTGEVSSTSRPFAQWAAEVLGQDELPEEERLDTNKMAVLEDAYSNTPLFILQGPPGTGKSETVCALVKLIFSDDPLTQVLLTSRENATVKELLRKLFKDSRNWQEVPIVKLSPKILQSLQKQTHDNADPQKYTMDAQAVAILEAAKLHLNTQTSYRNNEIETLCQQWKSFIAKHTDAYNCEGNSTMQSVIHLLEQSANFIFTTASDKMLADMIKRGSMLDWAFIEEAGKTPFYDLLLPMLVSQRWMLLGDPQQLEPFQATEFGKLMDGYKDTVEKLQKIKEFGRTGRKDYISIEHIEKALTRNDKRFFERQWVLPFRKLFDDIDSKEPARTKANGESAAMLNMVYRMPPALTRLDGVFYGNGLLSAPMAKAYPNDMDSLEPSLLKANPLEEPEWLCRCSAMWIDTSRNVEMEQMEDRHQICNPGEARLIAALLSRLKVDSRQQKKPSLIVLTPYRRQVREIQGRISEQTQTLEARFEPAGAIKGKQSAWVSTIDSFQGCQADIVIVSLVRNSQANNLTTFNTIKFVADENRTNVMISRAQQLFIIVGSYKYFANCCIEAGNAQHKFHQFLQHYEDMSRTQKSAEFIRFERQERVESLLSREEESK